MKILLSLAATAICFSLFSQPDLSGFREVEDSIFLKRIVKGKGDRADRGDYLLLRTKFLTEYDSVVFDSQIFNDGPVEYRISKTETNPLIEGLLHMRAGDSAVIYFPAEMIYDSIKPEFYEKGLWMYYQVKIDQALDSLEHVRRQRKRALVKMKNDADVIVDYLFKKGMKAPFKTPSGTFIHWHKRGEGISPDNGDHISVHYRGYMMNGDTFDNSWKREEPLSYVVGKMKLIEGWQEAIPYLSEGDSVTVIIPSPLAYGEQGSGLAIPPDAILLFDIKLVEASNEEYRFNKDTTRIRQYVRQHGMDAEIYSNGVAIVINEKGGGKEITPGSLVELNYDARLLQGQIVENHMDESVKFRLNTGQVNRGLEFALLKLNAGSKAEIIIPSKLAFGPEGTENIPSDAVLIYRVHVLSAE